MIKFAFTCNKTLQYTTHKTRLHRIIAKGNSFLTHKTLLHGMNLKENLVLTHKTLVLARNLRPTKFWGKNT